MLSAYAVFSEAIFLDTQLILASGSPRRRELLTAAGISFVVQPSHAEENAQGSPMAQAAALARIKAEAMPRDPRPVLTADTLVALDGCALGKPADEEDARRMLTALSGRTHQVFTGVCLRWKGVYRMACQRTDVTFRTLSSEEIDGYIASGEPMDKAGAYGIQGGAGAFVERIDGPRDNVIGLPVALVQRMLAEAGID